MTPEQQQQARDHLQDVIEQALRGRGWGYEPSINEAAEVAVDAVLADPRLVAEAMGGRVKTERYGTSWATDADGNEVPVKNAGTRIEIVIRKDDGDEQ